MLINLGGVVDREKYFFIGNIVIFFSVIIIFGILIVGGKIGGE